MRSSVNGDLYGCDTWSLTLKKGRMPRVLENGLLRKILGPLCVCVCVCV